MPEDIDKEYEIYQVSAHDKKTGKIYVEPKAVTSADQQAAHNMAVAALILAQGNLGEATMESLAEVLNTAVVKAVPFRRGSL